MSSEALRTCLAGALAAAAPIAAAEVVAVSASGFQLAQRVDVSLPPAQAFDRFAAVGDWWSDDHTYSGQAHRMRIDLRPGGCWCETLPDRRGGVQHMQVVYVDRPRAMRFEGGLGPLQELGAHGAMTLSFAASGTGTKLTLAYRVAGFRAEGFANLAADVDRVRAEQLRRYADVDR
jgi:uncharacterized protein YndB with AHSA1/START domain